jgi:hypothetical protein
VRAWAKEEVGGGVVSSSVFMRASDACLKN